MVTVPEEQPELPGHKDPELGLEPEPEDAVPVEPPEEVGGVGGVGGIIGEDGEPEELPPPAEGFEPADGEDGLPPDPGKE